MNKIKEYTSGWKIIYVPCYETPHSGLSELSPESITIIT